MFRASRPEQAFSKTWRGDDPEATPPPVVSEPGADASRNPCPCPCRGAAAVAAALVNAVNAPAGVAISGAWQVQRSCRDASGLHRCAKVRPAAARSASSLLVGADVTVVPSLGEVPLGGTHGSAAQVVMHWRRAACSTVEVRRFAGRTA